MAEACAAYQVGWMQLAWYTPAEWAERMAGPALWSAGWTALPAAAESLLIREQIETEARTYANSYLAQQAAAPGLTEIVRGVIRTRRLQHPASETGPSAPAGLTADALDRIHRAYDATLRAHLWYDEAHLFEAAVQQSEDHAWVWHVLMPDELTVPGRAAAFIEAASTRLYRTGTFDARHAREGSAAAWWPDAPVPDPDACLRIGTRPWSGTFVPSDRDAIALRTAPGRTAEVRGLLRELVENGTPLDQVEIAYTSAQPYRTLVHDLIQRYEVPATFEEGIPASLTGAGEALAGFFRWIGSGFDASVLVDLCRARRLRFDTAVPEGRVPDAAEIAGYLSHVHPGRGRHWHQGVLDRLAAASEDQPQRAQHIRRARQALDAWSDLVPERTAEFGPELVDAGQRVLDAYAAGSGPHEAAARDELSRLLRTLRPVADTVETSRAAYALWLERAIADHAVCRSAPRPGAVHVSPFGQAGYTRRAHIYAVGMDEQACSEVATGSAPRVYSAAGEAGVDAQVHSGADGHIVRLADACTHLTLTACTLDLVDSAPLYPAARFQQVARQLGFAGDEAASDLHAYPLIPACGVAGLDDTDLWLAARHATGYAEAVAAHAEDLAEGQHASRQRTAPVLSRFDGCTGQTWDLTGSGRPVSASQLETLAACPYRFFLKHVLDIRPPDTPDDDTTRWLHPSRFGQLLHDLYCDFMRALEEKGERPSADHADHLQEMLDAYVRKSEEEIPAQHRAALRSDRDRLERSVRVFLSVEEGSEAEGVGYEVSFGSESAEDTWGADPIPLRLADDLTIPLQGRIDRIDRRPDGSYVVWDYKTGSMRSYDASDVLDGGQRLQWALYAYIVHDRVQRDAGEGLPPPVSGYYFANDREYGRRLLDQPPPREALADVLRPLIRLAEQGAFVRAHKSDKVCDYCDYNRICGGEHIQKNDCSDLRAADQTDDAVLDALEAWLHGA